MFGEAGFVGGTAGSLSVARFADAFDASERSCV